MFKSLVAGVTAMLAVAGTAFGAGTPDIALDKSSPGQVLAGEEAQVGLVASNPGPQWGYNLSFRDVLPAGVSYVAGSAGSGAGDPQVIANQPAAGQTTLVWSNLADLAPASDVTLSYRVRHATASIEVGDAYTNTAGAYVNSDPREVPQFSATGAPSNATGNDTDSATTTIAPFLLEISEPSPEGEILRGLHDHQTVYTLTLRNNAVAATTGVGLEAWFPADLEFLGCGTADNTTDAATNPGSTEEYPGSGPINPGNAPGLVDCPATALVETLNTTPPGLTAGVWTHVVFAGIADLAPGETRAYQVAAAVPLRANTTTWTASAPSAASGLQAANLDNNSGALTYERAGGGERPVPVAGTMTGDYQGPIGSGANPFSDDATLDRVSEDVRMRKTVTPGGIAADRLSTWTIRVDTSEYRSAGAVSVTDTVPDGLCPAGGAGCPDTGPPPDPYTSATENSDGTWTVTWDGLNLTASGTLTLTLRTHTRLFYREAFADDDPVLAHDSWANTVSLDGTTANIAAVVAGEGGPSPLTAVTDDSSAGQSAPSPEIEKLIGSPGGSPGDPAAARCAPGTATYGQGPLDVVPGDLLCYRLSVDFPSSVYTGQELGGTAIPVTDFLPTISGFVAGSLVPTGSNTVTITDDPGNVGGATDLRWTVGSAGAPAGTVAPGARFDVTFAAQLDSDPDAAAAGLKLANLLKYADANSAGEAFPQRDQALLTWATPLTILKGVASIDGVPVSGYPPPQDNLVTRPGETVRYEVDVTNPGGRTAEATQVWDVLPPQISCADVSAISDGGLCDPAPSPDRITWTGLDIAPGATRALTYDVLMPGGLAAGAALDNTAGVRTFRQTSNTGVVTDWVPSSNIDPSLDPSANTVPVKDPSRVRIVSASIAKTRTTSVVEPGNSATQATIGETVSYTVTTTIPSSDVSLYDPLIRDVVSTRTTYVPGSAEVTLPDGTRITGDSGSAGGWTLQTAGGDIRLAYAGEFRNTTGQTQTITLAFRAVMDDEAANVRGGTLPNTGTLSWRVAPVGGQTVSRNASVSTPVVEPNVAIVKTNDAAGVLSPGRAVAFSVSVTNPAGPPSAVSTAHDLVVTDVVPAGLGDPAGITGGGVWDPATRTITWTRATLDPGARLDLAYSAVVGPSALLTDGMRLENVARSAVASLGAEAPGRRTAASAAALGVAGYSAEARSAVTVSVPVLAVSKSLTTAPPAEVGRDVGWRVTVANTASAATAFGVDVVDTLPPNWTYVPGSARRAGQPLGDPAVAGAAASGLVLTWADVADLAAGASLPVTFEARPRPAAAQDPGTGTTNPHVNTAVTRAVDSAGAPASGAGPYAAGPATAQTFLEIPVLEIDKSPDGAGVEAGAEAEYRIVVRNTGEVLARGVTVVDDMPAGVAYTAGTATAESGRGQALRLDEDVDGRRVTWTFTRLAPGGEIVITVPVRIGAPLPDGDVLSNPAEVTSREVPDPVVDTGELIVRSAPTWGESVKASSPPSGTDIAPGGRIDYSIALRNDGNETATDVVLFDAIPVHTTYRGGTAAGPSGTTVQYATASRPDLPGTPWTATEPRNAASVTALRWLIPRVPPGETLLVRFGVTTATGVADSTQVVNDARLTSRQSPEPITLGPVYHTLRPSQDGGGVVPAAVCARGGRLTPSPSVLRVGVPTDLSARVTTQGRPVGNHGVRLTGAGTPRSALTDGDGVATFRVRAGEAGQRVTLAAPPCGRPRQMVARRTETCRDVVVSPRSVTAGVSTVLRVALRSGSKPVTGVRVRAEGAGAAASGVTGAGGGALLRVTALRPGFVRVTAPDAFTCGVRVGVTSSGTLGASLTG